MKLKQSPNAAGTVAIVVLFALLLGLAVCKAAFGGESNVYSNDDLSVLYDSVVVEDDNQSVLPVALPGDDGQPIPALPLAGKTIMLDPGHGGNDVGAIRDNICEKDINLSVALKLKELLERKGATVLMTRDSDTTLSLDSRVALIARNKPDIFVSIHTNASLKNSVDGIEAYYYNAQSKDLADMLFQSLVDDLNERGNWVAKRRLRVVRHQEAPAVLLEIGYLSKSDKRQLLASDAYREQIAEAIKSGIEDYFVPDSSVGARVSAPV